MTSSQKFQVRMSKRSEKRHNKARGPAARSRYSTAQYGSVRRHTRGVGEVRVLDCTGLSKTVVCTVVSALSVAASA